MAEMTDSTEISPELLSNFDPIISRVLLLLSQKLSSFDKTIKDQNQKIIELEIEVTDIKKRVQLQEPYSSKDCLIFYDFPINISSPNSSEYMCEAIKRFFKYS